MGQPSRRRVALPRSEVYPHLRGAATGLGKIGVFPYGISPLAWGSLVNKLEREFIFRYIPTCVGQPFWPPWGGLVWWVYPHLRGAASILRHRCQLHRGISPLAWGSLPLGCIATMEKRYIPTCVGQPMQDIRNRIYWRVYPHLRGAAASKWLQQCLNTGISPLAWGSHMIHEIFTY